MSQFSSNSYLRYLEYLFLLKNEEKKIDFSALSELWNLVSEDLQLAEFGNLLLSKKLDIKFEIFLQDRVTAKEKDHTVWPDQRTTSGCRTNSGCGRY